MRHRRGARYCVDGGADVWALGVLLYCMLTGNFPWELARYSDPFYREFLLWHRHKRSATPSQWRRVTSRGMRLFRKLLEPRLDLRCKPEDIFRYIADAWLVSAASNLQFDVTDGMHAAASDDERGGVSGMKVKDGEDKEETAAASKEDLGSLLKQLNVETRANKRARDSRIREWVLST